MILSFVRYREVKRYWVVTYKVLISRMLRHISNRYRDVGIYSGEKNRVLIYIVVRYNMLMY